ncbi:short-chain dehydrogenase, partial [Arthrobacter sp. NPDC056493]
MTTTPLTHTPQDSGVPMSARDFSVMERVVLITGAGQGIGRAQGRPMAAAGARGGVGDKHHEKDNPVVEVIKSMNYK